MALFKPLEVLRFTPESYLPSSPYIPSHFIPQIKSLDAKNFEYEIDELGQRSIIKLEMDNNILVPFVDLNRYDSETKDWFWYDTVDNFPYRYLKATNKLVNMYPSKYSDLTPTGIFFFDKDIKIIYRLAVTPNGETVTFYKYSPLILTVNNEAYNDLTDYSNFKPSDRLNKVNNTIHEFYYDFAARIYTNMNLAGIEPSNVKIHFFRVSDNKVQVKCRMSANLGAETYYTPRVNNFILKLKGQSLRV